jgi:hypothetical protein
MEIRDRYSDVIARSVVRDEAISKQLGDTCTPWHLRIRQGKCA